MTAPKVLMPLLEKHNLAAFNVNEGWILIRRKTYIDIFIEDQPYNSVEVLLHSITLVRSFPMHEYSKAQTINFIHVKILFMLRQHSGIWCSKSKSISFVLNLITEPDVKKLVKNE